jgi:hypothetical protein
MVRHVVRTLLAGGGMATSNSTHRDTIGVTAQHGTHAALLCVHHHHGIVRLRMGAGRAAHAERERVNTFVRSRDPEGETSRCSGRVPRMHRAPACDTSPPDVHRTCTVGQTLSRCSAPSAVAHPSRHRQAAVRARWRRPTPF